MTARRKPDTPTSLPGGISGANHAIQISDSMSAAFEAIGGVLQDVAGTGNVITANLKYAEDFTTYSEPLVCRFKPIANNTGVATIAIEGLAAKPIKRYDGSSLQANDLVTDRWYTLFFVEALDYFILQSNVPNTPNTESGLLLKTSPITYLGAATSRLDAHTILSTVFNCSQNGTEVIVKGMLQFSVIRSAGSPAEPLDSENNDARIRLVVDGSEKSVDQQYGYAWNRSVMTQPFMFRYDPGDTSNHTYAIKLDCDDSMVAECSHLDIQEVAPNV